MPRKKSNSDKKLVSDRDRTLSHRLRAFRQYNDRKIDFTVENLPERDGAVFTLITFLIHTNEPYLPGYVSGAPFGVDNYLPPKNLEEKYRLLFPDHPFPRGFKFGHRATPTGIITIAAIGSPGSVAQSVKSDIDVWVVTGSLKPDRRRILNHKLDMIKRWADSRLHGEIHFFPMTVAQARKNDFGRVEDESAGSAMGMLLKEEFYRTMTLMGGRVPLWWLADAGASVRDYRILSEELEKSLIINPQEIVDLGLVLLPGPDEYFGAALWQINKTVDSPFKSVLKMGLLELYLIRQSEPLADSLKKLVWSQEEQSPELLDPYLLMVDRIGGYLRRTNRAHDLDLLRACLYLKTKLTIRLKDHKATLLTGRKRTMVQTMERWGWSQRQASELNEYQRWSVAKKMAFAEKMNKFVLATYGNLARALNEARSRATLISDEDLTVLGRRLYGLYGAKQNKIPLLPNFFDEPLTLSDVTLYPAGPTGESGSLVWEVYAGALDRKAIVDGDAKAILLKRAVGLGTALAWLVINELYASHTYLHLAAPPPGTPLPASLPDIQAALGRLVDFFAPPRRHSPPRTDLLRDRRAMRLFLMIIEYSEKISYPATVLTATSWGEVFGYQLGQAAALDRFFDAQTAGIKTGFFVVDLPHLDNVREALEKRSRELALWGDV